MERKQFSPIKYSDLVETAMSQFGVTVSARSLMITAFGFSIASSYLLMPVRDAQISIVGKDSTWKLIICTTILSLVFSMGTVYIVRKSVADTCISVSRFYRLYMALILFGYFLLPDAQDDMSISIAVSSSYYVLSEAFKLLSISLLWSLASDTFDPTSGVVLYSLFGLSCTIGQTVASLMSWLLLSAGMTTKFLLLLGAISLEVCANCIVLLSKYVQNRTSVKNTSSKHNSENARSSIAQYWNTFSDSYVVWISVYTLGYTMTMYLIYLDRISILQEVNASSEDSGSFSATINLVASVCTCVMQILLSYTDFKTLFGINFGLFALPSITLAGFASLNLVARSPAMVALFEILRRVTAFAVSKPSREALYSVVSREDKYLAKSVIDTFVYRLGGSIGALIFRVVNQDSSDDETDRISCIVHFGISLFWLLSTVRISTIRSLRIKRL